LAPSLPTAKGLNIVKKPRADSAVAMGAIVSIEIAVFLDHLRRLTNLTLIVRWLSPLP
jgi:hypothetical protein